MIGNYEELKLHTLGPYDCLRDIELKRICCNHVVAAYYQGRYRSWALWCCCSAAIVYFSADFLALWVGHRSFDLPTSEVNLTRSNVTVSHLYILPLPRETGRLVPQDEKDDGKLPGRKRSKRQNGRNLGRRKLLFVFYLGFQFLTESLHVLADFDVENLRIMLGCLEVGVAEDFGNGLDGNAVA